MSYSLATDKETIAIERITYYSQFPRGEGMSGHRGGSGDTQGSTRVSYEAEETGEIVCLGEHFIVVSM